MAEQTESTSTSEPLPQLADELWRMVLAYLKQETVEPVKGLGRYVAVGMGATLVVAIALVLFLLSGLRALQGETQTVFTGELTWVPYAICTGGTLLVVSLAAGAIARGRSRATKKEERS